MSKHARMKTEKPLNDSLGPAIRQLVDEVMLIGPAFEDRVVGHVDTDVSLVELKPRSNTSYRDDFGQKSLSDFHRMHI